MSLILALASFITASIGSLAGTGGAILLVPILVATGMPASVAAPLGLVSVAATSVAAAAPQLRRRDTNHRLGVTTEITATLGAAMGALGSGLVSDTVLGRALALVAVAAAIAMLRTRAGNEPDDQPRTIGEWPGQIGGVAAVGEGSVAYRASRLPVGLSLMWMAGVVSGVAGIGGGFIKTPIITTILGIPTKVAAATTTFTIGVTAAAGLIVFAIQGRLQPVAAAAVIAGGLIGGQSGARLQRRVPTAVVRVGLAITLLIVSGVLWLST